MTHLTAARAILSAPKHATRPHTELLQRIADAIEAAVMAERKRCAGIATNELRNTSLLLTSPPQSSAAWDIRNAINSGDPA